MIRINQIKLKPNHKQSELEGAVWHALKISGQDKVEYKIAKRSIDSRHKPDLLYIYSIDVEKIICNGKSIDLNKKAAQLKNRDILTVKSIEYSFPENEAISNKKALKDYLSSECNRPVIIGFGPAGIFAALKLAEAGLCPVVYERGDGVDNRLHKVEQFWAGNELDTESNVQFGEGGAGTFSDGKLYTMIKDPTGRIKEVLSVFVRFGADPSILYINKPHIGTDVLAQVVKNIREYIISTGGEIYFRHRMDNIIIENEQVSAVELTNTVDGSKVIKPCKQLCIALGHSARDTFSMLNNKHLAMEPKAFAVGLRMEHPQDFINNNAYGQSEYGLPAADYKVTYQTQTRGVYSFCMCPGGYVVNASSENGMTAVNGMSYSGRNGVNSNSAMIVTVTPEDFGKGVMDGIEFQRKLERAAYKAGDGTVPVQLFGDFEQNIISTGFGVVKPATKGLYKMANLRSILPEFINGALIEGIHGCSKYIRGFDMKEAVLSGVESRTSSPLRIIRKDNMESISCVGLYPCGEGAGYAGGITSAAVDGIKTAEKIAQKIDF